ncbi:MAG: hypothetical protein M3389_07750 [Actinomycetota bacterium]|nr:hypothetical protein [Actinomycetota bacterium]
MAAAQGAEVPRAGDRGSGDIARLTLALAAGVLLVTAAPAAAGPAPPLFQGITGQDHYVTIAVDARGVPQYVDIEWETRRCRNLPTPIRGVYSSWHTATGEGSPDRATRRRVSSVERLRFTLSGNRTMTVTSWVSGRRSGARWVGTIRGQAVFRRRGRVLEVCGMRRHRWRAGRHEASLTLTGDRGDWVSQGFSYEADHRSHNVRAGVQPGYVTIEWVGNEEGEHSFGASFRVRRPRAGRTYTSHDAVDVGGVARGCGSPDSVGTLKVERVRLDRKRRVRFLVATYEQRCHGDEPAAHRGRITFRRGW